MKLVSFGRKSKHEIRSYSKGKRKFWSQFISKTPIVHAGKIHENLYIKSENLQGTGAFKLRGAYFKLS